MLDSAVCFRVHDKGLELVFYAQNYWHFNNICMLQTTVSDCLYEVFFSYGDTVD